MRMRQRRWMMAVALGAALGADLPADEVAAKRRKKESLSARIDGKLLKASGKHYTDSFTAGIALVQGDTPLRLGKVVRAIAVGCGIDLATSALPVTPVFPVLCTMGYATFSFKGGQGVTKQWAETNVAGGVEVTFESFDGTCRVRSGARSRPWRRTRGSLPLQSRTASSRRLSATS